MSKVLILGGDGYLGWPTAMYLSSRGFEVSIVDNFNKRCWEQELGVQPLVPVASLTERVKCWEQVSGKTIRIYIGDINEYEFLDGVIQKELPDTVIHYGEQPSAPFSMRDRRHAVYTQVNNIVGTLNLAFCLFERCPETHIVKLGTMGEYGTPNIDIEEGYITIEHKGRQDRVPYPKQPHSFYHLSKVHDSHNLLFASHVWGLKVTDLNQGVVYGTSTPESRLHPKLATSFHYDETFGTVINRFLVQVIKGIPLTVYGKGGQGRGFLNILDTLACVELAVKNPASKGEFRVFNQFTEQFTVFELAEMVCKSAQRIGLDASVQYVTNPRVEKEQHYYNAMHSNLLSLGLKPHLLTEDVLIEMIQEIKPYAGSVIESLIWPATRWVGGARESAIQKK